MPTLDEDQIRHMREEAWVCQRQPPCGQTIHLNYCRQCDEFFTIGHREDCPAASGMKEHAGHRTY